MPKTEDFSAVAALGKVVNIPCPGADADSHGLDCLADHGDSPVAVVQGG